MIRNLFLLVAFATMSAAIIGCGIDGTTAERQDSNGLVFGGTDVLDVVPEIGIYKTTVTRGDTTETTFHLESDVPVPRNLVVYVTYSENDGEFIVIKQGNDMSEAFDFMLDDDTVSTVTLQPDTERVKVSLPKLAKNTEKIEITVDYNFAKYPYTVDTSNSVVSR